MSTNILNRRTIYTPVLTTGAVAPITTTWSATDHFSNLSFSPDLLTVTQTLSGTWFAFRGKDSHSTGKYYFEIHLDSIVSAAMFGIGNASASVSNFIGADNNCIGWNIGDGKIWMNSANPSPSPIQVALSGSTLCIAIDMGNTKIWYRTDGGNWNNDVIGNQNPATNTGGASFSSMNSGPWFPMGVMGALNDVTTANFGATTYAQAKPSGYSDW